jgi:Xaa-Pro aminopeptidase
MIERNERIVRIQTALQEANLDALLCTLPANVLLLSGYWPVVGTAVAVATRDGQVAVLAPEDESDLARRSWATRVHTYEPATLARLSSPADSVREPLSALLGDLGVRDQRIAWEAEGFYEPASYAALYLYGPALQQVLSAVSPDGRFTPASSLLTRLRATLTDGEHARIREACTVAACAFREGLRSVRAGQNEATIAAAFEAPLSIEALGRTGVERAGGFAFCMSGPNSALAGGAYARTRARTVQDGDLILVHCNSYVDGYWTDITRTYYLGEPDERARAMYAAVFEARTAALAALRPGVLAREVDQVAREILTVRGFGGYFPHGLGHSVGFSAISMQFPPRLHPASDDRLEIGMVFNIEPAIYIHGYGGLRHCDVVSIGVGGATVLTPFQDSADQLLIDR